MLKAIVESLDNVDEKHRELYEAQSGGGFRLKVEGVEFPEQVAGLKSALEKLKRENGTMKITLKALEGIEDLDEVPTQLARLAELEEAAAKGGGKDVEAVKATYERKMEKAKADADTRIGKLQSGLRRALVDAELESALTKLKVPTEFREAAKALIEKRKPDIIENGDDFVGVFPEDVDGIPNQVRISTWVESWAKTEGAKAFLPPSGKNGSDNGGSGGNDTPPDPTKGTHAVKDGMVMVDPQAVLDGKAVVTME